MTLVPIATGVLAAMAILTLFLGLYRLARPTGELEIRLDESLRRTESPRAVQEASPRRGILNRFTLADKVTAPVALALAQARFPLTVNEYVILRLGCAVGGFLLGSLLLGSPFIGLALAIGGLQAPMFYLTSRRRQRVQRFQGQLVDVITMLVSGLQAGVGLTQAMELVRREMPAPSGEEFGLVVRESALGIPAGEALRHLNERMPSDDLGMIITVINIQAEVGGNLAQVPGNVATTIRERVRITQEIRTLTAMQRTTSYILAGLPFIVGGLVMVINPGYMQPLFTLQWAWLLGVALVMVFFGFIIIKRIADIKV